MPTTKRRAESVVITSATPGRTLDIETRTRRYLWIMGVRTACFLAFLVVPGWWKVVALAGAVLLPAIAVLFANNADHRPVPMATEDAPAGALALTHGEVIPGSVEDES